MKNPERYYLRPFKVADIVLVTAVVFFSVFLWARRLTGNAEFISVSVNNTPVMKVSIKKNGVYPIRTPKGNVFMEVKAGKYRLKKHEYCPNGHCWKMEWVRNKPIICVPLKLSIEPASRITDAITE